MASKISKGEWKILMIATGAVDLVQFLIGVFEVPLSAIAIGVILIAINEGIDLPIGIILLAYFQIRGVNMIKNWKRSVSLIGAEAADAFSGGIASLWILDVMYLRNSVQQEEDIAKAEQDTQAMLQDMENQPLNSEDGVRQPSTLTYNTVEANDRSQTDTSTYNRNASNRPLNFNGTRRPNGTVVNISGTGSTSTGNTASGPSSAVKNIVGNEIRQVV